MKGPISVVTTFGLGRSAAQVGMIAELDRREIVADQVMGTSLGAVNAAGLAAGCGLEALTDFWRWANDEIFTSPARTLARGVSAKQSRKHETQLRERIAALVPEAFDQLQTSLVLAGTDLATGEEVLMQSGDLLSAVMASAAIPGVLPPVAIDGRQIIDGGLVAGLPLRGLDPDAGTVLVLDTGHAAVSTQAAAAFRWWEVGAMAYAHLVRGQAVHALLMTAATRPVVLISTEAGRLLDFLSPEEMIEAGRSAASDALDQLPDRLRPGIYGLPDGLDEYEVLQDLRRG